MQEKWTEDAFRRHFGLQLDEQQTEAMRAVEGPVLLLAVPGSGKTTVLLSRLGYLIFCCGVAPSKILTMTYTVAATQEMRDRFARTFGKQLAEQLQFSTINSICARILRIFERETGRKTFEIKAEGNDLTVLLRDIWLKRQQEYPAETDLKALRIQIGYIKNQMLTEQEIEDLEIEGSHTKVASIYREYCRIMREKRWMDYDDQMVYALQVLKKYPGILAGLQQRYAYFCVDEAQDTSKIQHIIIRLLANYKKNLFMVGDEDQSIYGFRAAYPEMLMHFEQVWPKARVLLLENNYRSTPQIVASADQFISLNSQRREKRMRATRPDGCEVRRFVCQDKAAQYQWIARLGKDAIDTGMETAILYRDNDSALPVIDLLSRQGLPYRAKGTDALFFTSRIVRDVTDTIHLAEHPNDAAAFLRIYYKFKAGISKIQAEAAAEKVRRSGKTVWEALQKQEMPKWCQGQIQRLKMNLTGLPQLTAEQAIEKIATDMNYETYLTESGINTTRLDILRALATQQKSCRALLQRLTQLEILVHEGTQNVDCPLILSTIHSSKGMEYRRVILADVVDGTLPRDPALGVMPTEEQIDALEEDRRLFYVGMTRAKEELTIAAFTKAGLHSTFAAQVFPPPEKALAASVKRRQTGSASTITAGYAASKRLSSKYTALSKEIFAGVRVTHARYGAGRVITRDEDKVTIEFENHERKMFSVTATLNAGLLQLAQI